MLKNWKKKNLNNIRTKVEEIITMGSCSSGGGWITSCNMMMIVLCMEWNEGKDMYIYKKKSMYIYILKSEKCYDLVMSYTSVLQLEYG